MSGVSWKSGSVGRSVSMSELSGCACGLVIECALGHANRIGRASRLADPATIFRACGTEVETNGGVVLASAS